MGDINSWHMLCTESQHLVTKETLSNPDVTDLTTFECTDVLGKVLRLVAKKPSINVAGFEVLYRQRFVIIRIAIGQFTDSLFLGQKILDALLIEAVPTTSIATLTIF